MLKWFYYMLAMLLASLAGSLSVYYKGLDLADLSQPASGSSFEDSLPLLEKKQIDVIALYNKLEAMQLWSFWGNKPIATADRKSIQSVVPAKKVVSISPDFLGISVVGKIKYAIFIFNGTTERVTVGDLLSNGWKLEQINNRQAKVVKADGSTELFQLFKGK